MVKPDVQTAIMELIDKMDENQLLFTSVAIDSIVTPAITAKAANDLAINGATGKDVIVKLGDAVGAKKLIVKDSANAEQASLNSDGLLTVKNIVGNLKFGTADTSGAPTAAEMASAFGAVTGQAGAVGVFLDSGAEGKTYLCICDGVAWHTIEGTVGV